MKKVYEIDPENKAGFLLERKKGIGASDVAAICGLNPYASTLSVWYDKTREGLREDEENIPAEIGLILEDYLEKKFVKKFKELYEEDLELLRIPYILAHDEYDFCRCTLDRYFMRNGIFIPAEFKTTSEYQKEKWKEDEIPEQYYLQVQWQIFITGAPLAYVGFLIGNRVFDIREIPRNDKVIDLIFNRCSTFWNDYVIAKIMPAPDGSEVSGKVLKELYSIEFEGKILDPTEEEEKQLLKAADDAKAWNEKKKEAEKKFNEAKQNIIAVMKDAEMVLIGSEKVTHKTVTREGHYVKPSKYRLLDIRNIL
ncbi:MAG: YqaJ viral recombinase family protein [Syntrophaceae bacterium]|nr:YqaJ viral recombinase family protein [Syntrophaceae bacterium]